MDYYSELGIDKNATDVEIKQAYRRMAKTYHPDRNKSPDAEEKIKRVNEAYDVLSDKNKKAEYDSKKSNAFAGFGRSNFDIGDIFSNSFDFNKPRQHKHKFKKKFESQSKTTIQIDFSESILGVTDKKISHIFKHECSKCSGFGGEFQPCNICGGSGSINRNDGFISINITCTSCSGSGKKIISPCTECGGEGYIDTEEELAINIPEGLEVKTKLFVKGKGNLINGSRGDLYITVEILPDPIYRRHNNDIHMTVDVDVVDIMLESSVVCNTLKGEVPIHLTPAVINDKIIQKSMGTKTVNSDTYGDLIITINPTIPKLSDEQKNILKSLKIKTP